MLSMAIPSQFCKRESIERKPWTSEARNDVFIFLAQSFGLVCVAVFLFSLGPSLGATLIAVSIAVWSLLRSQIASEEEEDRAKGDGWHAAPVNSPLHWVDPFRLRDSDTFSASTNRPVTRQGA